ncbi:hypothetical protein D3C81_1597670 [compost metagenome]
MAADSSWAISIPTTISAARWPARPRRWWCRSLTDWPRNTRSRRRPSIVMWPPAGWLSTRLNCASMAAGWPWPATAPVAIWRWRSASWRRKARDRRSAISACSTRSPMPDATVSPSRHSPKVTCFPPRRCAGSGSNTCKRMDRRMIRWPRHCEPKAWQACRRPHCSAPGSIRCGTRAKRWPSACAKPVWRCACSVTKA